MTRDPRYDVLFEPVRIGPHTTKNRFFQVPHCTGMGSLSPHGTAKIREIKAEGGWGVVCTEGASFHPTSEIAPFGFERLWSDEDIAGLRLMVDVVHRHGALAGIELQHEGSAAHNRLSRERQIGPSILPARAMPTQVRAMDKSDIRELRRWYRAAARRAIETGFDIVYVHASQALSVLYDFLSRRRNRRTDEYGGSLENRVRLLKEVIEDVREEIADRAALAVRYGVDELLGEDGFTCEDEGRDAFEMLAELPDLWDVNVNHTAFDVSTSRFQPEGFQERFIAFAKRKTTKPVVGVGRFTSPDTMVSQIKRGILDLIGAARPSIADPYLPRKIEEGRIDDIRECIGCNVCLMMQLSGGPIRCTQNPTMGEEWRRGWHPERIAAKKSDSRVLVVGGGPAGLEATRALGKRGYDVTLAEASTELGGRVSRECRLPGLGAWSRVRDYRVGQIQSMINVETYLDSRLSARDILEFGFERVVFATGCRWTHEGIGHFAHSPIPGANSDHILSPDDLMERDAKVDGPVVVYDEESFYMGAVIAEKLALDGHAVTIVTPRIVASEFLRYTGETQFVQTRLRELGIETLGNRRITQIDDDCIELGCVYTDSRSVIAAGAVVMVGLRQPNDELYEELMADEAALRDAGIRSIRKIGDCNVPGMIAEAVFEGHRYAREFDEERNDEIGFRVERVTLDAGV